MNISLITVASNADLLAPMLAHYRNLGIDELIVHVNVPTCASPALKAIAEVAESFGTRVHETVISPWFTNINAALMSLTRHARPDDWFVLADQDEYHSYPCPLAVMLGDCDRSGFDYVEGALVDRVASSGKLEPFRAGVPISEQFPIACQLTSKVMLGVINKVVVAKGRVLLGDGQHRAGSGRGCPPDKFYVPVFHYKWLVGVTEELERRVSMNRQVRPRNIDLYTAECERFLAYFANSERIRLEEQVLRAFKCDPDYPAWDEIVASRMSAAAFSVDLAVQAHRSREGAAST